MKQILLLFLVVLSDLTAQSQGNTAELARTGDKFFFGLTYSFLDADMKLLSMTKQSVWAGEDFGTLVVDQEEIDTLNSFVDYTELLHEGILTAGMVLLDKPDNPWLINGTVTLGFGKREHGVFNTRTDTTEMSFNSKFYSPSIGIGLNFSYKITDHWRMNLQTHTLYLFGNTDDIRDKVYEDVGSLEESRKNTFDLSYSRLNLMVAYTLKDFTFSSGPGFYILYNWNEYEITRTNPVDGQTYMDTIDTKLRTSNFINGSARIDWRASDHFQVIAGVGISKDITVSAGIFYFL